jgi:PGF-pre-PGF domain-containing protein
MEKNKPYIKSAVITIIVIAFLVFSWQIAEAVKVSLNADKTEVIAGDFTENQIKFTIWVNLSYPDAYIPLQRVYLNLTGNSQRYFSFDLNGNNINGYAFLGEINVSKSGDLLNNYSFGPGIGYDFNDGSNNAFGEISGYAAPLNISYVITLNTSNMSEGDYNAETSIYAEGSNKQPHGFSSKSFPFKIHPRGYAYPVPTNPTTSSGGGGGGGGSSGENASNIESIEKYDLQITKDVTTSYKFTYLKSPIMFVNITGNTSLGIITASEEVLKSTSTLVKTPPGGLVYKNINIWMGTSGIATPKNIKEALIKFKVDNNWMSANSVTSSDIILVKWNGNSWIELETSVLSKDDTNTFFEGKTYAFSPFAIAAKTAEVKPTDKVLGSEIPQPLEIKETGHDEKTSQPAETAIITKIPSSGISTWSEYTILIVLIIDIIVVAMYFLWVKK